jgi:hypothetical protein
MPYSARDRLINQVQVRSDANGAVMLPTKLPPGNHVAELKFLGDGQAAPSIAKFAVTITS